MIKTNCSKCGADLILHEGYGVCSNCGEIIGFDIEEEIEEKAEEVAEVAETEEIISETENLAEEQEETVQIQEEASVIETQEVIQEIEEAETEEKIEEQEEAQEEIIEENVINNIPEEIDIPKRRKAPVIILTVIILCVLAVLGGYFISKVEWGTVSTDGENTVPEEEVIPAESIIEEEPEVAIEEHEEKIEEPEKVETAPVAAPVKQDIPEKETVKKEDAVISPTPSISYRIRKTADDSTTQIGAFSDLERAKAFAVSHTAEGYKVFDMDGQLVFEP